MCPAPLHWVSYYKGFWFHPRPDPPNQNCTNIASGAPKPINQNCSLMTNQGSILLFYTRFTGVRTPRLHQTDQLGTWVAAPSVRGGLPFVSSAYTFSFCPRPALPWFAICSQESSLSIFSYSLWQFLFLTLLLTYYKGYNLGRAKWKRCAGQGMGKGSELPNPPGHTTLLAPGCAHRLLCLEIARGFVM